MTSRLFTPARIFFSVLVIACMAVIFNFSREDSTKSSETSGKITKTAVHIAVSDYDELPADKQLSIMEKATHIIRKSAHFSLYALLGFLTSLAVGRRKLLSPGTTGVIVFCFLYAVSDEIHQYFVPGRSCEFRDMIIDTSGAFTGMLFSMAIMWIFFKIYDKKSSGDPRSST